MFASVLKKYSSRSRSNLCCVALKFIRRATISSRSRALRRSDSSSIIPIPCFESLTVIGLRDWGAIAEECAAGFAIVEKVAVIEMAIRAALL